jgi:hypothetical protein
VPITGSVKDEKGGPLQGVSIKVKGTTTVVSTDANGNFRIEMPSPSSVLVFTFIGYDTKEVTVGSQATLAVNLKPSSTTLKNVEIVSIGYGTISSKEVTRVAHVIHWI